MTTANQEENLFVYVQTETLNVIDFQKTYWFEREIIKTKTNYLTSTNIILTLVLLLLHNKPADKSK